MESEDIGMDEMRERFDVFDVLILGCDSWDDECRIRRERVVLIFQHLVIEIVIEESCNESSIFIVCDSASIVTFCR